MGLEPGAAAIGIEHAGVHEERSREGVERPARCRGGRVGSISCPNLQGVRRQRRLGVRPLQAIGRPCRGQRDRRGSPAEPAELGHHAIDLRQAKHALQIAVAGQVDNRVDCPGQEIEASPQRADRRRQVVRPFGLKVRGRGLVHRPARFLGCAAGCTQRRDSSAPIIGGATWAEGWRHAPELRTVQQLVRRFRHR